MSNLQRLTKRTLVEQIVAQLERLIENGTWQVGERIPAEPELVKELGVSRNTIREAVHALIHAGMLRTRQGDGTYVCSSSSLAPALTRRLERSKLGDTLDVRSALEQEGARLAALRRTPEDMGRIRSAFEDYCRAEREQEVERLIRSDYAFHNAVIAAAHNSILSDLYESIREAVQQVVTYGGAHLALLKYHTEMNERLMQAIAAQDAEGSAEAVRSYIDISRDMLLKQIEGGNEWHHE
ncbi:FadR/GntR family transcriptional regulator [Paenibacillus sp. SAF-054]|uniref:FadR/GntR family transcriptional regulator n=1 Tax=unclassified Paenibacillus TaxID=185978 RepID=UPI003F7E1281